MNEIGEKIKELRKKKGLSQEELAELAKVNLRTIQRIEKNESEPRGKTLNLICEVLEINIEDILDYGKLNDSNFLFFYHLSVISYLPSFILHLGAPIYPVCPHLGLCFSLSLSLCRSLIFYLFFLCLISCIPLVSRIGCCRTLHGLTFSSLISLSS